MKYYVNNVQYNSEKAAREAMWFTMYNSFVQHITTIPSE